MVHKEKRMGSDPVYFSQQEITDEAIIKEQRRENIVLRNRAENLEVAFHDLGLAVQKGKERYSRDFGMPLPSKPFAFEVAFGMHDWHIIQDLLALHPADGALKRLDNAIKGLRLALEIGASPNACPYCSTQMGDLELDKHCPECLWAKVKEIYDIASGGQPQQ